MQHSAVLLALIAASPALQAQPVTKDSPRATYAVVDVSVIRMDGEGVTSGQTVIIRDGRIAEMGNRRNVRAPSGAIVINGSGKYLIPGLAEMHAHIPGAQAPAQLISDILFLYVANGITTIRGMLGAPNQLDWRRRTASGEALGPTIIVGAPSLSGQSASSPDVAARLVREHKAAGYDFLKLHPGLSRASYDAIVATAREVGISFGGHVSADVGIRHSLASGQSTIDHIDGYLEDAAGSSSGNLGINGQAVRLLGGADTTRMQQLAQLTRDAGAWVVPTEYLWENFFAGTPEEMAALPEMKYATQQMRNGWMNQRRQRMEADATAGLTTIETQRFIGARRAMLRALARNGNTILMGTDSPQMFNVPGFALQREIVVMAAAGMTPYQILESGTRNVSRYVASAIKGDAAFGTVAVGNHADLVLLDANPLASVANLERRAGVFVRGRWVSADEIRRGLDEIARRNAVP